MRRFDGGSLARLEQLLAERPADEIEQGSLRRAAVLIPIVQSRWSLVFVWRSEDMRKHSGQIAFPGGGHDEGEELHETAMRETEEEIGVEPARVELIGRLDDLVTHTGFVVAPFVGVIPPGLTYVPHEAEVQEVFEVPIDVLFEPGNPEIRYVPYRGEAVPSYFYRYEQREIWGLTGRIVKSFLDVARLAL